MPHFWGPAALHMILSLRQGGSKNYTGEDSGSLTAGKASQDRVAINLRNGCVF